MTKIDNPTKQKYFKELKLEGKYKDFTDFYDENKETIYKSIIDVFKEFKETKKTKLTLNISAKIKGLEWDTEFNFDRSETIVLKRDVMPYFEEIEDYETCGEVLKLYDCLTF
jgi:hypothetical protein